MSKAYIRAYATRRKPEKPITDCSFDSRAEEARTWPTQQEAESSGTFLNSRGMEIDSSEGGKYICDDFKVEKRADGKFVLFCAGPFIQDKPSAAKSKSAGSLS